MTRETKVGLVVGLGVILLVGIFVSDYLRVDQAQDSTLNGSIADFNNGISNQPPMGQAPAAQAQTPLPGGTAAVALDNIERNHGQPTDRQSPPDHAAHRVGPSDGFNSNRARQMGQIIPGEIAATDPREIFVQPPPVVEPDEIEPVDVVAEQPPAQEDPVIRPTPPAIRHTVQDNETLSGIARQYYDGNSNMWISIRDANKDLVGPEGQVRVGASLVIPMRSESANEQPVQADLHDHTNRNGNGTSRRLVVTVKEGDTLSGLAATHLGSAGKWQVLMDANTDQLTTDRDLRAGMRLRIPVEELAEVAEEANRALAQEDEASASAAQSASATQRTAQQTYTVQSGDSLYAIASKTLGDGNRYDDIFQANRDQLSTADDIAVGMVLKIPNATTASAQ